MLKEPFQQTNPSEEGIKLNRILGSDISRKMPVNNATEIIMQRHENYIRGEEDENTGSLFEDAAEKAYEQTKEILRKKLEGLSAEERKDVSILVAASDTKYMGKGMRSIETAGKVYQAVREVMSEFNLDESQILNNSENIRGDEVRPIPEFREPKFLDESPEFFEYLCEKYGKLTQDFWKAFEEDLEKETREEMGAEGPPELLKRYSDYVEVLSRFSRMFHHNNPNRRLLIWTVSHYDVVSPYVKSKIADIDPNTFLAVDYGGGVSVNIDQEGKKTCDLRGKKFEVSK